MYEIIETKKQLYLIMEFAEGGELFDYIVSKKRLEEKESWKIYQQIIGGIEYISKLGIVHRDLKPENLLLDYNNTIKIVDFGLSNTFKKGEMLKTACGSPCYAAPEMIEGKEYHGTAADVWSSGVILFAMMWGYLPFEDQDTGKLYKKILAANYQVPSFLSKDAIDFLTWILNVDPEKRYTIDKIRAHKWYKQHEDIQYKGIIVGNDQIPVNSILLKECSELGYDGNYALKCIETNKHNSVTATYNLLLNRNIREGKITLKEAFECKKGIKVFKDFDVFRKEWDDKNRREVNYIVYHCSEKATVWYRKSMLLAMTK
jgi:5'-AMP-activated protein kinase, catalytic alpha subunit